MVISIGEAIAADREYKNKHAQEREAI